MTVSLFAAKRIEGYFKATFLNEITIFFTTLLDAS